MLLAPKALHQVAASPVPFEELGILLKDRDLSPTGQRALKRWIEDVNFFGKAISQKLLFSFLQSIVKRHYPEFPAYERVTSTFYLAWRVHRNGLSVLVDDHPPLIRAESEFLVDIEGQESVHPGERLPLEFPLDFAFSAYAVQGHSDVMMLHSPSPLSLGVWGYETLKKRSCIPYLKILYMDEQGRFFITERIEGWLDSPEIWDRDGIDSEKNRQVCKTLAKTVDELCRYGATFDISTEHLFLTHRWEIGTLKAFEKRSNRFHIPTMEKFIRTVCHEDRERICCVMHMGNLFAHPICTALRDIIRQHSFQATDFLIRERMRGMLDEDGIAEIIAWHAKVQNKVRFALPLLGKLPRVSSKLPLEHLSLLAEAFCALQTELGFVMDFPHDISQTLVSWVECHYADSKK